ncbi:MAG: hypothetical protein RL060_965 [Bacteroidota bacterium]
MAENINHIDTIEAYLNGKLDGNELDKFEQLLQADSNLKNEVEFQQTIKDGLFEVRRLELKQRLNAIKIEPAFEWTIGKIAAGVAMVGLLGLGINYLMSPTLISVKKVVPMTAKIDVTDTASPQPSNIAEPEVGMPKKLEKVARKKSNQDKLPLPIHEELNHGFDVETPSIPMEHNHHHVEKHADGTTPNGKIEQIGAVNIAALSVDIEKSKDKFHYKYYADKLVLVGDFSKGPYELIELNKNQAKNLYLYYDGDFYELHYGTENMDHLMKITQSKLQKELRFKIKK